MAYEDIYEGLTDDEKEKMIKADIPKLNGIFMTIWWRRHKGHSPESSEGWGWRSILCAGWYDVSGVEESICR